MSSGQSTYDDGAGPSCDESGASGTESSGGKDVSSVGIGTVDLEEQHGLVVEDGFGDGETDAPPQGPHDNSRRRVDGAHHLLSAYEVRRAHIDANYQRLTTNARKLREIQSIMDSFGKNHT